MCFQHDLVSDGLYNPYQANDMHTVYIFYDPESREQVEAEANTLVQHYRGLVGILMVDV